ncbi:hypothetical protein RND81_02G162000 [Saponaria officinalis]|uniref:Uncharacterized protein n=1 Tax=Saponaria officinalis TaxID=3572 RepID=A0AAW1MVT8_SAPOF
MFLHNFLGCWMVGYKDRSPRCRRVLSALSKPFWLVFPYFFLRFYGVSASCSCLLTAWSSRWLVEVVCIAEALDDNSRAQFTVLHALVARCILLLEYCNLRTSYVMFYIVVYKYDSLSRTTMM